MSTGNAAELEVLKFSDDDYSFQWTKVGSRRHPSANISTNFLKFQSICQEDYGYYRCEVKEAGSAVLTVYRALYRDESKTPLVPGKVQSL